MILWGETRDSPETQKCTCRLRPGGFLKSYFMIVCNDCDFDDDLNEFGIMICEDKQTCCPPVPDEERALHAEVYNTTPVSG